MSSDEDVLRGYADPGVAGICLHDGKEPVPTRDLLIMTCESSPYRNANPAMARAKAIATIAKVPVLPNAISVTGLVCDRVFHIRWSDPVSRKG